MTEDLRYLTASETEQILKKYFYGTWVEYTTQKKLTITKCERGGKRYGIYTATTDGCFTTIYYYYMDNPKKIYIGVYVFAKVVAGYSRKRSFAGI